MTQRITILSIISLTIFIRSCSTNGQAQTKPSKDNVFAKLDYDSVIAYSYNGENDIEIIDKEGKLADRIKKQIRLDKTQVARLTNTLCDKKTYGGDRAACFDPHFGVVFYKRQKPIAYVSVCLDCNYLISSIDIPVERGFSYEGAKAIIDFEKELKFMD